MERVYHKYILWEDYKNGMYSLPPKNIVQHKKKVAELFLSYSLTYKYMSKVISLWHYSCENNLTNLNMNRVAYLGQAACNIYYKTPRLITMAVWSTLPENIRDRADCIALKIIKKWELERSLNFTLKNGKKGVIQKEYQMKLLLN
jgi:hypothetical protein